MSGSARARRLLGEAARTGEDLEEEEVLLARMEAGLYTLQQVGGPRGCWPGCWLAV